ncbi:MAG TPA: dynamin family protein, partial [Acidimicrobiales bacterium]|nr:dynamin family protein [Acidimicrobiales bacterium]
EEPGVEAPRASPTVASLAGEMAGLPGRSPAFAERALRLAERSAAREYHIAVLGEFKRGKSTLVNALIGHQVLPSGVVPVTTVVTEVHFSAAHQGATVVFEDGTRREVRSNEIAHYVSDRENPANRLGVRRVEVRVDAKLGAPGVVLVDTPGVASVNERQTLAAREALADSDGAVIVLSVDAPLSESEQGLLQEVIDRGGRLFVVVNKCDHLDAPELAEVRAFLLRHLDRLLGDDRAVYFLSARRALDADSADATNGLQGDSGFDAFRRDLEAFLRDDLAAARERAGAAELDRLAATLSESVAIERAAAALDLAVLHDRLEQFANAAQDVRRAFLEDRLVLEHDVAQIGDDVAAALTAGWGAAVERAWPSVAQAAAGVRGRALDRALDDAVDAAVKSAFDPLRGAVERTADTGWEQTAARFADRLRLHVQALRTAANTLFEVHLPEPAVPMVAEQREHFSYVFVQVESPGTSLARTLRAIVPTEGARRRRLVQAHRRLASELEKHAGRARFDVVQRLDTVSRRIVAAMAAELEQTEASIVSAATSAQRALESTESEQAAREVERAHMLDLAETAGRLTKGAPGADLRAEESAGLPGPHTTSTGQG